MDWALSPLLTKPALALLPAGNLPRLDQVHIDAGVLIFALVLSIVAGLFFGVAPAIRAGQGDLSLALRSGGRGASLSKAERRLSDGLIVVEIALSLVLLPQAAFLRVPF